MLYIKKGKEPRSLTEYKNMAHADYDGCNKNDIRAALMEEQGGLCAYCMCRLNQVDDVRIEHYIPQAICPEKVLSYKNMLGVCHGGSKIKNTGADGLTCDAHKKDALITVNPWDENSIKKIEYKMDGTIFSRDSDIDGDLDGTLNLNHPASQLKRSRKQVLDSLIARLCKVYGKGLWAKPALQKELSKILNTAEKPPYCGIMIWYLKKHIR